VVVVTGAGGPVGRATSARFTAAGATVVAVDRVAGPGIDPLDPCDPGALDAFAEAVLARHGRLDAWVNHHDADARGPADSLDPAAWSETLRIVLTGSYLCARAAYRAIRRSGGGTIVNVGTVEGYHSAAGGVAGAVAQGGLVRLTEALGVEWAPHGVRVVGVAYGAVAGEGTAGRMPDARIPLRRPATPDEIARAIEQLAGPEASYVVGETLRVDGGWSSYQLF
jgi:short-subunit dehydrogenase